jgi:Protein of unknown function (DUF1569)
MPERRHVNFDSLDGVMTEVERLLAGHETVGRWTLGQILYHLTIGVRLSMEGKRETETIDGRDPFRARRRLFFRAGRFPDEVEAPLAVLVPPDACDPNEHAEALRDAIDRFTNDDGPFSSHPILGAMSKAEWTRFHSLHCAHHLGFVSPASTNMD